MKLARVWAPSLALVLTAAGAARAQGPSGSAPGSGEVDKGSAGSPPAAVSGEPAKGDESASVAEPPKGTDDEASQRKGSDAPATPQGESAPAAAPQDEPPSVVTPKGEPAAAAPSSPQAAAAPFSPQAPAVPPSPAEAPPSNPPASTEYAPSMALNLPQLDEDHAPAWGEAERDHLLLELEVNAGVAGRLSDSADVLRDEKVDFVYALGGFFEFDRTYSFGVAFERVGLGSVSSGSDAPSVRVSYGASTLWGAARVFPWRTNDVGVFVQLQAGASLQTVDADGISLDSRATVPSGVFVCDGTGGPHLALGGAAGVDARIAPRVAFLAAVGGAAYRLSDDVVGSCARGVGSTAVLSARLGFAYHFDLGRL